jgi:hypothetical protein
MEMLGPTERDRVNSLALLAKECQVQLARQPTVVRIQQPVKVFGDVHGQLRDLLLLFREFGMPSHRGGDIECVALASPVHPTMWPHLHFVNSDAIVDIAPRPCTFSPQGLSLL